MDKKTYQPPAVAVELELETRAGTPLGIINPFNPAE